MSATSRRPDRDAGFTLPELLIVIVVMSIILPVIGLAITTTLRNAPSVSERADVSIAVQGITTWLPPDVDSAEPGQFDWSTTRSSGCAGGDPAGSTNVLRLQWSESFRGVTTTYVADYRYLIDGDHGKVVRLACSGQFSLGSPKVLAMSAKLSTTPPVVVPTYNSEGKVDQVTIKVYTLAGEEVFIEAATKNPKQTLPPANTVATTLPPTTPAPTPPANQPPVASAMHVTVNSGIPISFALSASDPENGALTATVSGTPSGWSLSVTGTTVTLTANGSPGVATLSYTVQDPLGATSAATSLEIEIISAPTSSTSTTTSTTTTSTTTTTTVPPCSVSSISLSAGTVQLQNKNSGKLKNNVVVTISGLSGYCVGLTLQYVTGAPNGQYVQNFGTTAPYTVTLLGHPSGTELWTTGSKTLEVRNGANILLKTATLVVTD